jgi:S-DNA-T family DNA segregation ATPase FtsK/SpoIIIE
LARGAVVVTNLFWRTACRLGLAFFDYCQRLVHVISERGYGKRDRDDVQIPPARTTRRQAVKPDVQADPVVELVRDTSLKPKSQTKRRRADSQAKPSSPDASAFVLPPLKLLAENTARVIQVDKKSLKTRSEELNAVLEDFGVKGTVVDAHPGPVVTLYELEPAPGIKSSRVVSLADDIARSMSAISARVAVIPGRNVIGIELPNKSRETVYLREMLDDPAFGASKVYLPLALGKDIGGKPVIVDLVKMPHLLVAGTTGSGKSVAINAMILSLLYKLSPDECRLIMIDPKMLELSVYDDIPHLLTPVVTDPKKAVVALKWAVKEMEQRYQVMSKLGVRNIEGYNQRIIKARADGEVLSRRIQTGFDPDTGKPVFEDQPLPLTLLPFIVVIVDEMADLMLVAGKEIEATIQRLAQMARAAGIHLIMATQRPSVDVITGTIKANFPTRISFQVTSKIDSRTILGEQGAEQLLGQGDMLHMAGGGRISRIHGPFVSDKEVESIVSFLKTQGQPDYVDDVTVDDEGLFTEESSRASSGDALYDQAMALVLREGKVSTSFIQRHLQIGYNRAARIVEQMEDEGVISKPNHQGKREILAG